MFFYDTGSLRRYLLGRDGRQIFELMELSGETRSWFIGNSLQTGNLPILIAFVNYVHTFT